MCPHGCPHKRAKLKGRYRLLQAATRFDLFSLSLCNTSLNGHSVTTHHNASDSAQIPPEQEVARSNRAGRTNVFNHLRCSPLFPGVQNGPKPSKVSEPRPWRFWLSRPAEVPENRRGHGMPIATLLEELAAAGFSIEHVDEAWRAWPERRFCVIARKP